MLEMITFVSNEGLTGAAGLVEVVIIAPIAIVERAVIAVIIAIVVYWAACANAGC